MDIIEIVLAAVDPLFISPYRTAALLFENPLSAWWAGTFVLSLWAVAFGKLTLRIARSLNGSLYKASSEEAMELSKRSMNALRSGDKEAYNAINRLANEAFGKSFFQQAAVGASSLWPVFLGAAWLEARFGEIRFPCPGIEGGLSFVAPYLVCYLGSHLLWNKASKHLRKLRTQVAG